MPYLSRYVFWLIISIMLPTAALATPDTASSTLANMLDDDADEPCAENDAESLLEPHLSDNEVLNWARKINQRLLSFHYLNSQDTIDWVEEYFNQAGYQHYLQGLEASQKREQVRKQQLILQAKSIGRAKILKQGRNHHQYAWQVQLPLELKYYSCNEKVESEKVLITLLLLRVPIEQSHSGIVIGQWLLQPHT